MYIVAWLFGKEIHFNLYLGFHKFVKGKELRRGDCFVLESMVMTCRDVKWTDVPYMSIKTMTK